MRLEALGFTEVSHYVNGKLDWMAAGLPMEGTRTELPWAGDVARTDVPTATPDEPFDEVHDRVRAAGWDTVVVVNQDRVVLGLLRAKQLQDGVDGPVERSMRAGPSTFRPHVPIAEMAKYMTDHDLVSSPITSSDGRLIGLLRRADAVETARRLRREHEPAHRDYPT